MALAWVFSEYFGFPCQFSFRRLLHIQRWRYVVSIPTASLNNQGKNRHSGEYKGSETSVKICQQQLHEEVQDCKGPRVYSCSWVRSSKPKQVNEVHIIVKIESLFWTFICYFDRKWLFWRARLGTELSAQHLTTETPSFRSVLFENTWD
jgi:hypothetical protein